MEEKKKTENEEIVEDATEVADENEPLVDHYSFPWRGFIIVFGTLITLIVICVIVILCNGGFYQW